MSASVHYLGFDIHKKMFAYCVKTKGGNVRDEGTIRATRQGLSDWLAKRRQPRVSRGAMEATLFTGWVYDYLSPHARQIKVTHPAMLKAIAASKKKNDRVDARKIADLLRPDLLPECHMASKEIREPRRKLRYRQMMRREAKRMNNKISGLRGTNQHGTGLSFRQRFPILILDEKNAAPAVIVSLTVSLCPAVPLSATGFSRWYRVHHVIPIAQLRGERCLFAGL